jgi:hypothetical protein
MVKPSVLETRTRKKSCKTAQLNGKRAQRIPSWPGVFLQQRPYTFAQTNLSIHCISTDVVCKHKSIGLAPVDPELDALNFMGHVLYLPTGKWADDLFI